MGVKVEGSIPSFLKMLKQQMIVDSILKTNINKKILNDFLIEKKNYRVMISGMSNYAASSQDRKDLLFPPIYHLILDYNQMPLINWINKKDATFNLIPGRQSKYKITLSNKIPNWYTNFIICVLPLINNLNLNENNESGNPENNESGNHENTKFEINKINVNIETGHIMFGLNKKFYGANFDFNFGSNLLYSKFIASYYLLPININT